MNKVKRNILIIAVIMITAIIFKNFVSFDFLPDFEEFSGDPDYLKIEYAGEAVEFKKNNEIWTINSTYAADNSIVSKLINELNNANVENFISDNEYYSQYDLTDSTAVKIVLKSGEEYLRNLYIGKESSSKNSVYMRIAADEKKAVYLVSGINRTLFSNKVDYYRNKNMLNIPIADVSEIKARVKMNQYVLYPEKKTDASVEWKERRIGKQLDQVKVNDFINSVLKIEALSFLKDVSTSQIAYYEIKSDSRNVRIELYDQDANGQYICKVSDIPYVFTISSYQAEKMLKNLKDLLK